MPEILIGYLLASLFGTTLGFVIYKHKALQIDKARADAIIEELAAAHTSETNSLKEDLKTHEAKLSDLEKVVQIKTEKEDFVERLIEPIRQCLSKVDTRLLDLEKVQVGTYEAVYQQVKQMITAKAQEKNEYPMMIKLSGRPQEPASHF